MNLCTKIKNIKNNISIENCTTKLPPPFLKLLNTERINIARMSSTTAAPSMILPAFVERYPYSCSTFTVIDTDVAAKTIP